MKIDEPKTPYVTDEEFRKACEEDPDYQAEFGNNEDGDAMRSDEAVNENDDEMIVDAHMEINKDALQKELNDFEMMSDEGAGEKNFNDAFLNLPIGGTAKKS